MLINEAKGLCEAAGYEVVHTLFKKIIFKNQSMGLVVVCTRTSYKKLQIK